MGVKDYFFSFCIGCALVTFPAAGEKVSVVFVIYIVQCLYFVCNCSSCKNE